jgi:hypothetical protein
MDSIIPESQNSRINYGTLFSFNRNVNFVELNQTIVMNRIPSLLIGGTIFLLTASFVLKGDTSSIDGKTYKITITEAKKGGKTGAPETEEVTFKGSKFRCKFFGKNAGTDAIPIDLTVDSTYTDNAGDEGETEMIYVEFEGQMSNKLEETVKVTGTIDGYGIEGSVELSKKEKVKKHWDFVGGQKDKKGKK